MKKLVYGSIVATCLVFGLLSFGHADDIVTYDIKEGTTVTKVLSLDETGDLAVTKVSTFTGNVYLDGNLLINDDDIIMGSTSTVVSTATTAGTGQGTYVTAYLVPGDLETAASEGSLLIATTPASGYGLSVGVSTGSFAQKWLGVAASAASTGTVVNMYTSGVVFALTTGTVNVGDLLVSTDGAVGYLSANNDTTNGDNRVVGVALSAGTTTGGRTKILLR